MKKKFIIAGIIIVLSATLAFIFKIKSTNKKITEYNEITMEKSEMIFSIQSTGSVQPENKLEIKPPIAGRVEDILTDEGNEVKKGQILAWMSSTERAALIDAAISKGRKELKRWEEMYKPTPIIAPINGTIIQRNVEAGQVFSNSDAVFVMSNRLTVKALVDETDIAEIKTGKPALIVLDAYPDQTISAKVSKIAFDAQTVNNVTTYTVDVTPVKTPGFMRSGMTANVTFFIKEKKDLLKVPNDTLKVSENDFYVLVKNGEKHEKRFVKTGLSDGNFTEILNGLTEGDVILSEQVTDMGEATDPKSRNPFMPVRPGRRKR
ncbi:MAG: efflux RND transporter periplasmic adaptor subunit [Oligoflexia bacterium]|nr:efflux RND transporter periplasmic adaptor subunit [Oligoflexia bacterium]